MRKRKTRTRIGSRALALSLIPAAVFSLFLWAPAFAGKKKEKAADSYSVVAGTVFREPGFALPEAEVTLAQAGEGDVAKGKKMTFTTNTRGEFAFRVPPAAGRYVVAASARGYGKQRKTVEVQPSERVDVTFTLAPESK